MSPADRTGVLEFLRAAERLKATHRSAYTSTGRAGARAGPEHTPGDHPPGFDYRFNLGYGRRFTAGHPVVERLRAALDRETERRAVESETGA